MAASERTTGALLGEFMSILIICYLLFIFTSLHFTSTSLPLLPHFHSLSEGSTGEAHHNHSWNQNLDRTRKRKPWQEKSRESQAQ
jgi:hypothetical protein